MDYFIINRSAKSHQTAGCVDELTQDQENPLVSLVSQTGGVNISILYATNHWCLSVMQYYCNNNY